MTYIKFCPKISIAGKLCFCTFTSQSYYSFLHYGKKKLPFDRVAGQSPFIICKTMFLEST